MSSWAHILNDAVLVFAGASVFYMVFWWRNRNLKKMRLLELEALAAQARAEADAVVREARLQATQETLKARDDLERSFAARRAEAQEQERRFADREVLLSQQLQRMVESEAQIETQKQGLREAREALRAREKDLEQQAAAARSELERLAGMTQAGAREVLLERVGQESRKEANELSRRIVEEAKAGADDRARQIISVAIQRYAGQHTFENTTASVAIQGDEIKGRIIGREGRNIRAFEAATGVTVMIDDTPGAVLLSGFDPVRREIARESMQRLIQDGRIHPTRIEEIVGIVTAEMEETIVRLGEQAVAKAGLPPFHPEIVKLLGRLHFRHSYSQNILDHSVEVAHLMGLMAAELGLDVTIAKRAGLLHDLGKAVNHEVEGPHALVGAELIRRLGEPEAVVNGVASHHNDVPPVGPWGILVGAADAISASRPGARSESMTTYLKRVEDLERIASMLPGVGKAYAVQAGRELRVFVQPENVNDEEAYSLARTIASQVENELQYPGQIKITVIRETRCVEVAK